MTFANSRKPYSCWGCEYFVHENPVESYAGYCRRAAPKALDLYGPGPNILSSKGDLMTRDDDELIRLPIGDEYQYLVVDPAEDAGMKWDYVGLPLESFFEAGPISETGVFPQPGVVFTTSGAFRRGTYLILASYTWSMNGLTDQFYGDLIFGSGPFSIAKTENGIPGSTSEKQTCCGHMLAFLEAGAQAFTFQLGVQTGGTTDSAIIEEVHLSLINIKEVAP